MIWEYFGLPERSWMVLLETTEQKWDWLSEWVTGMPSSGEASASNNWFTKSQLQKLDKSCRQKTLVLKTCKFLDKGEKRMWFENLEIDNEFLYNYGKDSLFIFK